LHRNQSRIFALLTFPDPKMGEMLQPRGVFLAGIS
jgi:hypothetical protein